jgi:hypothetical protein
MAGYGGARPGAGRKRKSEKYSQPIAAAEDRIADRLPALVDHMMELAAGVTVREMTADGPKVYTRPPDRQANEYLINRILGKPVEAVEQENSGEMVIRVEYVRRQPELAGAAPGAGGDPLGSPALERRQLWEALRRPSIDSTVPDPDVIGLRGE